MNNEQVNSVFPSSAGAQPPTTTEQIPVVAGVDDVSRMHPAIARSWDLWSTIVGQTANTRLKNLKSRFPELAGAVLSTSDGLLICSLDVNEAQAGQLAAMNSSLYGVAKAESDVLSGTATSAMDAAQKTAVSITTGDINTALLAFIVEPFGQLLLAVSAREVALGTLMVQVRNSAKEISDALGQSAPDLS